MDKFDHLQLLPYIDNDDYEVWYQVGMALKHEGYSCDDRFINKDSRKKIATERRVGSDSYRLFTVASGE